MTVKTIDWFVVSTVNMKAAAEIFKRDGFTLPSPRCFGRKVKSFDLSLQSKKAQVQPQWKLALNRLGIFL